MRVLLDTKVWIDLKEKQDFLRDFTQLYHNQELEIVFSHGNFLDLVRRDNQDKLAPIIANLTDEYLADPRYDDTKRYDSSTNPLILARFDKGWYDHCVKQLSGMDGKRQLQFLFRDGNFDPKPATNEMTNYVGQLRSLGGIELEGEIEETDNIPRSVALKKIGLFADYAEINTNDKAVLHDHKVPIKEYIHKMSMIYLSETHHEIEEGDFRDVTIWLQAIIANCDVLWTEIRWKYEHPIISQVIDRLEESNLEVVKDYNEFRNVVC